MHSKLKTSKTSLVSAKRSCCYLFSRVVSSSKERWARMKTKRFLDIIALTIGGPKSIENNLSRCSVYTGHDRDTVQ